MPRERHPIRWVIWILACSFYFYEYILRIEPSTMIQSIMTSFGINATLVGILNAAYFYAYAPMQIPVGLLMDRYGPRKLLTLGTLACGLGGILFGAVLQYEIAVVARVLMGFGSSFAFIGMVYVCSHWFSGKMTALLIGIGNSLGMAGAMWGEALLGIMVNSFGWRYVTLILGLAGVLLTLTIYLIFRLYAGPPSHANDRAESVSEIWVNMKLVLAKWQTWLIAFVALTLYLTTVAFAGLWGETFLEVAYKFSTARAGIAMSMVFLGWMVGGPIIGFLGDRGVGRKLLMAISGFVAGILMALLIYTPLPNEAVPVLLFFVGFFSSSQLLTLSYVMLINPEKAKGTAAAFTNFMVMVAGSIAQPFVGFLLNVGAEEVNGGSATLITADDFRIALAIFPIAFFVAAILSLFLWGKRRIPSRV